MAPATLVPVKPGKSTRRAGRALDSFFAEFVERLAISKKRYLPRHFSFFQSGKDRSQVKAIFEPAFNFLI